MRIMHSIAFRIWSIIYFVVATGCDPSSASEINRCSKQNKLPEISQSISTPGLSWGVKNNQFEIFVKSTSDFVMLCCSIQEPLIKIQNETWYGCFEIMDIEKYALDIGVIANDHRLTLETWVGRDYSGIVVDGSSEKTDRDSTFTYEFDSKYVGKRRITMYIPTQADRRKTIPVMYVADGQSVSQLAHYLEKAINEGLLPPVVLVGIWPSNEKLEFEGNMIDGRALEYLAGYDTKFPDHFKKHNDFLIGELIPYVENKYNIGLARNNRIIAGFSNGGAWAISTALENSGLFSSVISASAGWTKSTFGGRKTSDVKFFINYGNLESSFKIKSSAIADSLRNSGNIVYENERLGGHSMQMWKDAFIASLRETLK
ncbi:MAG: alpha/beta hydrolase [Niveispirillum sp.]|uniref:alpha/beta hydrolase n=1 Tax=Niveispirillum sp. TaxID=1917217 RepID=UPI003BA60E43